MNTVIIYGIEHKGSTYNVVQMFKNKLNIQENKLKEYFLPKHMPHFCIGCNNCFMKGEEYCPNQEYITPIKEAILDADLIIMASPVYVYHVTGQMKVFLDHFAFQHMIHRPNKSMFSKMALVVSIAAGGGLHSTIKDMTLSLERWGVSKIYKFGCSIYATKWENMTKKNREKIEQKIKNLSQRIISNKNKVKSNLRIKIMFSIFRLFYKKYGYSQYEKEYWEKNGWLGKNRPWKHI